jgi:hypothetical protein
MVLAHGTGRCFMPSYGSAHPISDSYWSKLNGDGEISWGRKFSLMGEIPAT